MTDYEHLLDGRVWADIPEDEKRAMDETFGPEYCPVRADSNVVEWTEAQGNAGHGACNTCGKVTWLRIEPFGHTPQCKEDWERICYGEGD